MQNTLQYLGGSLASHTSFQNVRDAGRVRDYLGGSGKFLKIRPPEIESEPYVEQLCKQNHKCHLEFSPLIINARYARR